MADLNHADAGLAATNGNFPDLNGPYLDVIVPDPRGNDCWFDPDYGIDGEIDCD